MNARFLSYTLPTIITILSFIWYQRKKRVKNSSKNLPPSSIKPPTKMSSSSTSPSKESLSFTQVNSTSSPKTHVNELSPKTKNKMKTSPPHTDNQITETPCTKDSDLLCLKEDEINKEQKTSTLQEVRSVPSTEADCPLESSCRTGECDGLVESFQSSCHIESPSPVDLLSPSGCTSCLLDHVGDSAAGNHSDVNSEGSNDSGRGGSDIVSGEGSSPKVRFEFEFPQELCGRLIGRQGKNITYIKNQSNTRISIKRHPFSFHLKLCSIEGTESEVQTALELIRSKFPLTRYPTISLLKVNPISAPYGIVPQTTLHLPMDMPVCVILSSMVTAGHFFLQQPTHPTHPALWHLNRQMLSFYTNMDTPLLPTPISAGAICAAPVISGWFRAQVVNVYPETEECDIKFLDYGGYIRIAFSMLRQIWSDFMGLPFQATECYLANVTPNTEDQIWSTEACEVFEELAQGQILQAIVVGYAEDGIPYVELHKVQGETNVFINKELVDRQLAQWVSHNTPTSSTSTSS